MRCISRSRPTQGSSFPSAAAFVRSVPKLSSTGVFELAFFWVAVLWVLALLLALLPPVISNSSSSSSGSPIPLVVLLLTFVFFGANSMAAASSYVTLFISKTCLAPLLAMSCSMASSRCCSSILLALCMRASSTASRNTLLALSFSTRSLVCMGMLISSSLTRISSSVFTACIFRFSLLKRSITGPSLVRIMPNSKCSGPTDRLASRAASSREKASISDSFGENCVVIYCLFLLLILYLFKYIFCKDTTNLANIVPQKPNIFP